MGGPRVFLTLALATGLALAGACTDGSGLGGLLGPGLIARSDDIGAAVISLAGGRLLSIAVDNPVVEPFKPLLMPLFGSDADFERHVDAGDPATWAPFVLRDRISGADFAPDLLFPFSVVDESVPPVAAKALARALDIPQIGQVFDPVGLIPLEDAPVRGNIDGGAATAAYFQYDRVTRGDDVEAASHGNVTFGPEGITQSKHLLGTWLDSGLAEIIDPHATLGHAAAPVGSRAPMR